MLPWPPFQDVGRTGALWLSTRLATMGPPSGWPFVMPRVAPLYSCPSESAWWQRRGQVALWRQA